MGNELMKAAEKSPPADSNAEIALAALHRAAKRAHFIAYQHGTAIVTRKNGKLVTIPPDPKMYGDLLAEVEEKRAAVIAEHSAAYGKEHGTD